MRRRLGDRQNTDLVREVYKTMRLVINMKMAINYRKKH